MKDAEKNEIGEDVKRKKNAVENPVVDNSSSAKQNEPKSQRINKQCDMMMSDGIGDTVVSDKKSKECTICGCVLSNQRQLMGHMKQFHNEASKLNQCNICNI